MKSFTTLLLVLTSVSLASHSLFSQRAADPDPTRFADTIAEFARADAKNPVKDGGIVFVGSSSIRRMDVPALFPGLPAVNRGFGGSHISDVNYYIEETVLKYRPSTTVFFCGGNDLWSRKPALQVLEDFLEFKDKLFDRIPDGKLIVLATRPSPKRENILETELALNYLVQMEAEKDDRITFLRGSCDRFFDAKGNFFSELYHEDQLHMSEPGYQIWKEILSPVLPPRSKHN